MTATVEAPTPTSSREQADLRIGSTIIREGRNDRETVVEITPTSFSVFTRNGSTPVVVDFTEIEDASTETDFWLPIASRQELERGDIIRTPYGSREWRTGVYVGEGIISPTDGGASHPNTNNYYLHEDTTAFMQSAELVAIWGIDIYANVTLKKITREQYVALKPFPIVPNALINNADTPREFFRENSTMQRLFPRYEEGTIWCPSLNLVVPNMEILGSERSGSGSPRTWYVNFQREHSDNGGEFNSYHSVQMTRTTFSARTTLADVFPSYRREDITNNQRRDSRLFYYLTTPLHAPVLGDRIRVFFPHASEAPFRDGDVTKIEVTTRTIRVHLDNGVAISIDKNTFKRVGHEAPWMFLTTSYVAPEITEREDENGKPLRLPIPDEWISVRDGHGFSFYGTVSEVDKRGRRRGHVTVRIGHSSLDVRGYHLNTDGTTAAGAGTTWNFIDAPQKEEERPGIFTDDSRYRGKTIEQIKFEIWRFATDRMAIDNNCRPGTDNFLEHLGLPTTNTRNEPTFDSDKKGTDKDFKDAEDIMIRARDYLSHNRPISAHLIEQYFEEFKLIRQRRQRTYVVNLRVSVLEGIEIDPDKFGDMLARNVHEIKAASNVRSRDTGFGAK